MQTEDYNKYLCVLPIKSAETTCIQLIGGGGSNQDGDVLGLSHFLEHAILSTPEVSKVLGKSTASGAKFIASTSRDDVIFGIHVLKSDIELGHTLIRSILDCELGKRLNLKEITEKVKNEIIRNKNNRIKLVRQNAYKALYPGTRLAQQNIGEIETVNSINLDQLIEHKRKYYRLQNFRIVICGNSNSTFKAKITSYCNSLSLEGAAFKKFKFTSALNNDVRIENLNGSKFANILYLIAGVTIEDKLKYRYLILAKVLQKLVSKNSICYKTSVDAFCGASFGTFGIYGETATIHVEEFIKLVQKCLTYELKNFLTEQTFTHAKNSLIAELVFLNEKITMKTNYYAENILHNPNFVDHKDEIEKIKKVRLENVLDVLNIINIKPKVISIG